MFAHLVLLLGLVYKPLTQLFWSQPKPPLMAHSVPPGKVTLILPGFSTKAISSLLAFLATGVVTVDRPLLEEVGELAKVLELKEEMGRRELEAVSRALIEESW